MEKEELREIILQLVEQKNKPALRELFETTPPIDIAEALDEEEDIKILLFILRSVGGEASADFFAELTNEQQELILKAFTDKEIISMLENSFADDIVDTLEELPANLVSRILKIASPELRKDINKLLLYEEDTAGSVMTTEYLDFKDTDKVNDVIESIREKGKEAETVFTLFIRDSKRNMVGTVDLDDLIFAKGSQTMEDIMNRDFVTCAVTDDQETVANMFKRYDLNAMAVVSKENKIVGIITIDDVVDIIVEEASEDTALLNQVTPVEDEYLKTPVWKLFLKCIPWIIVLMVLQVFSTLIMSSFESALSSFIILTFFTAVICDAGGNSGGQTTTLIVRSLALDEFDKGDLKRVVWKELRVALMIGAAVCLFGFGWLMLEMGVFGIGSSAFNDETSNVYRIVMEKFNGNKYPVMALVSALVSLTLFVTIVISRLIGCLLPFLAKALKRDPAVVCGPMTTTIVDVVSLLSYFLLWTYVFGPMIGVI